MDEFALGAPAEGVFYSGPAKTSAAITAVENGYVMTFVKVAKREPNLEPTSPPAEDGVSEDERLDAMIDAMAAFFRMLNDKSAGEDWKEDGDREKIRRGFKLAVPSMARPALRPPPVLPKAVQLVFRTKEELFAYLSENL